MTVGLAVATRTFGRRERLSTASVEHLGRARDEQRRMHPLRPSSPLAALTLLVLAMSLVGLARAWRGERPAVSLREPPPVVDGPDARALRDGERLDLNRASAAELELLPRIGPAMAQRIVEARPFATVDELRRVRGIGARTLERLRPLVRVESTVRDAPSPALGSAPSSSQGGAEIVR